VSAAAREPKDRALVDNSADEEQIRAGKRTEKQRAADAASDLRAVLESTQGRRALWRVLAGSGRVHAIDAMHDREHFIAEGCRRAGLWLIAEMLEAANPDALSLCRTAHLDYERTNA
jgi:hypothetical protein